jgi:hypothetical protein
VPPEKNTKVTNPGNRGGFTTEQDVSAADKRAATDVPQGTTTGAGKSKVGVTGVPVGTPIYLGEQEIREDGKLRGQTVASGKTQYAVGDGMKTLLKLDNPSRVQLLQTLAQIPGVYPKGKAPTPQQLLAMAETGEIAIRTDDARALENIMKYADTIGTTYEVAAQRLFNQPTLAAGFYGFEPAKGRKQIAEGSLIAEIGDKFQNTFDVQVPKDIAKKYAAEVRAAYAKNPSLSAQERENIMLNYLEDAADSLAQISGQGEGFQPRGVLGTYISQLRQEYYDNGLPMDEQKIYRMAVRSLRDPQELESNKQRVRQRAELVFPPLREYIARGESVRDVLSPYMRLKASIFEKNDADINPSDMYDVMEGDKLKNINDYKMSLYRSPEYKKTNAYKQREVSDARGLLDYLGIE